MRRVIPIPALVTLLVGGVFTGQGLGFIPGSFMTGSAFWAVVGIVMVVAALVALVLAARRGSQ